MPKHTRESMLRFDMRPYTRCVKPSAPPPLRQTRAHRLHLAFRASLTCRDVDTPAMYAPCTCHEHNAPMCLARLASQPSPLCAADQPCGHAVYMPCTHPVHAMNTLAGSAPMCFEHLARQLRPLCTAGPPCGHAMYAPCTCHEHSAPMCLRHLASQRSPHCVAGPWWGQR
jgi:hypothetical protein